MTLKVIVKNATEAFDLNDQVGDQGLFVNGDYTWRFTPAINSWLGDETLTPATVEFSFVDPKWETYFQLRWAK